MLLQKSKSEFTGTLPRSIEPEVSSSYTKRKRQEFIDENNPSNKEVGDSKVK
jgi:hypothetical protein